MGLSVRRRSPRTPHNRRPRHADRERRGNVAALGRDSPVNNVAPGAHAALRLDGAGHHIAEDLKLPPNITLVHLPPYAPELNPMESVWEYLRGNQLAITVSTPTRTFSTPLVTPGCSSKTTRSASQRSRPDHGQRSMSGSVGIGRRFERGRRLTPQSRCRRTIAQSPTWPSRPRRSHAPNSRPWIARSPCGSCRRRPFSGRLRP